MKISTWLIAVIVCLLAFTGDAAAQCKRHFYNNSPVTFHFAPPITDVDPNSTADIIYLPIVTVMTVSSSYGKHTFGLAGCKILHSGSTGEIAVNSPADGDVTTCGGSGWPCPGAVACTRHVYNNSPVSLQLSLSGGGTCNGAAQCTISAGQVGELDYYVANQGQSAGLSISSKLFGASLNSPIGLCTIPVLYNPIGLSFNWPGPGDITTCGSSSFPCPASLRSRRHSKNAVSH
jgi:hypothetical protein